jgi:hypothetical protein
MMIAENFRYSEEFNIIRDLVQTNRVGESVFFIYHNTSCFPCAMVKDSFSATEWHGERLRQELVEEVRDFFPQLPFDTATPVSARELGVDPVALGDVARVVLLHFQLGDLALQVARALLNDLTELCRLPPELLVGHALETSVLLVDLVDDRLDFFSLALVS